MSKQEKAVVVTTEKKGVFFGYIPTDAPTEVTSITLKRGRMCVYWSAAVRGAVGLAATGPDANSRISPAAPELSLTGVTGVWATTDAARDAWEAAPWK